MSKEELKEELRFTKYELSKLVDIAKRCGNKDWRNTPMIKNKLAYIKELEEQL